MLSRRAFLAFAAALTARPVRAAELSERKFLFLFARGGWDPTYVFAPGLSGDRIDLPDGDDAEEGGIPFVDSKIRPAVRRFFEDHGERTAILNGMEVRSLTHERCRRLLFCGEGEGEIDDWAATIAANDPRWRLPHLVLTGPSFTSQHAGAVVRLGPNNQLADLLSGAFVERADTTLAVPGAAASEAARSFARKRAEAWAAAQASGQAAAWGQALVESYERLDLVREEAEVLGLGDLGTNRLIAVPDRVKAALQAFEAGYSRCALVEHLGLFDHTWDTHSSNETQSQHFELLFDDLGTILEEMESRSLLDTTTVVVLSEMGRAPKLNAAAGKDHWTFTSAMLIGAGVRGGTVVGGYDDDLVGEAVDGATMLPEHLGGTLFALAGVESELPMVEGVLA